MESQISLLRGTKDILETPLWQKIERTAASVFARYRCSELRTPVIEATELFARGIGEATDIVSKEMYTFTDRGERSITLRPEGTAGVVRAYIQNKLFALPAPQKFWYAGPMFRYERPQAGRQRQFHQIGVELLASDSPLVDAEAISIALDIFEDLEVAGLEVQLNSLGCPDCRGAYRDALVAFFAGPRDAYCSDCQTRIDSNPLRILDCKVPSCKAINEDAPSIQDTLCPGCREHQARVEQALDRIGVLYSRNPRLVRGLDYYTRTVFEVVSGSLGAQNTLCGGGRYDRLVEECGGPPTPAVGWSFGVERLALILGGKGESPPLDLFAGTFGTPEVLREGELMAFGLLHQLRQRGFTVEGTMAANKFDKLIKQANRLEARFLLVIGEDELERGAIILKDLVNRTQKELPVGEGLAETIALFMRP